MKTKNFAPSLYSQQILNRHLILNQAIPLDRLAKTSEIETVNSKLHVENSTSGESSWWLQTFSLWSFEIFSIRVQVFFQMLMLNNKLWSKLISWISWFTIHFLFFSLEQEVVIKFMQTRAKVTRKDIKAINGIIHEIDTILMQDADLEVPPELARSDPSSSSRLYLNTSLLTLLLIVISLY